MNHPYNNGNKTTREIVIVNQTRLMELVQA